jgi:hypothetical protein
MNPLRAPHVLAAVDECRRAGINPTVSLTNGGHVRLQWCANGKTETVFTSATPSYQRVFYKARAKVRRKLREAKP